MTLLRRFSWHQQKTADTLSGYLLLSPTIVILGTFLAVPVLVAIVLAFYKVRLLGEIGYRFVGIKNFLRMFADERVWIAVKNTIEYALLVVPTQTILALGLAVLLNTNIRGRSWFRVAFFLPTVTSSAVLTLIFMWIYNPSGLLNSFFSTIGLPTYNWLGDPAIALKAIAIMNIWSTAPLFMTIYLAALQDIPQNLYEAAAIDGANSWERFWSITLPLLRPVHFFVIAMGSIGTFQLFDQSYIFSGGSGGPDNATLTIVMSIYQYAFKNLDLGYALALTLVLATVIMLVTIVQRSFFKEESLD
jgi:multiple sugar transport system permease protein